MACGTGETYTSLIIAEDIAGKGKLVLGMVPLARSYVADSWLMEEVTPLKSSMPSQRALTRKLD